ncbi:plexin domain-containing protein 2-like isoform X3 [Daphnia carinata]|uniref:plexin domain-containing protein 2-like isoform X3 n=1 Tax=Daphnia carinata TaxID=120202 RepID=UPI00258011BF|nr:plexin domain-containing protein 2-like isoform X3 [Daphnia carinata]
MASSKKFYLKNWCAVFAILAFIGNCSADDYFPYESDELPSLHIEPVIKLLNKRQVVDITESTKKPVFMKRQSNSSPGNSTNQKLVNDASEVADMQQGNISESINTDTTTIPAPTSTAAFTISLQTEELPKVDYNGDNITVTNVTQDYHKYYNSSTYSQQGMQFWIDFDKENASIHDMLSQSHRRAATVALSFDFPFYGHWVRNITIATGGFLYTGDYVHSWLAATQYIAPLMANFDTSMSNYSTIKYMDNGTAFSVQWDKVALQDRPDDGTFSFQATLLKSGDIIFAYKDIPIAVTTIGDEAHPVKVGVSDAYIIDRTIFFVRRKTIYEYHKIDKKTEEVTNGSAIYFTALPTCVAFSSCDTCISNTIGFECVWCSTAERCSDGMDRFRQDWLVKGCDKLFIDNTTICSLPVNIPSSTVPPPAETTLPTPVPTKFPPTATTVMSTPKPWDDSDPSASLVTNDALEDATASNVSSVVGILFLVAIVLGLGGWIFYAYRNPHTSSGQCFIRYRPAQWRWRSGEAHYTAAAIHM